MLEARAMSAHELVERVVALREARSELYSELRLYEGVITERMTQMNTVALPDDEYDVRIEPRDYEYDMDALGQRLAGLVTLTELNDISRTVTKRVVDGRALRSLSTKYKGEVTVAIEASRKASGHTLEITPLKKRKAP